MNWVSITTGKVLISRVKLSQQQTYRLPSGSSGLRVLSGSAWLTHAGKDIVLCGGEEISLVKPTQGVVSVLGQAPLVFEVLRR